MANTNKTSRKPYRRGENKHGKDKPARETTNDRGGNGLAVRGPDNLGGYSSSDIALHSKITPIYDEVTKIPFDKLYGSAVTYPVAGTYDSPVPKHSVPLVMGLDILVGPGSCSAKDDPVNRALRIMMSDMHAKTSAGDFDFTQSSLGMFFTSLDSMIALAAELGRGLKSVDFWNSLNYGYPRVLVEAQGWDWNDMKDNRVDYMAQYNSIIASINNMMIPNFFDIYKQHYAMFSRIFLDEDSSRGQLYVPNVLNVFHYDDELDVCIYEDISNLGDFQNYLTKLQSMVEAWQTSQTFYRINGALLRAYKDAEFMQLPYLAIDDTIMPEVDLVFLEQLKNANILDIRDVTSDSLNITQDGTLTCLVWQPQLKESGLQSGTTLGPLVNGCDIPQVINSSAPVVGPDLVMLMTRLMCFADSSKKLHLNTMALCRVHLWWITPLGAITQSSVIQNQVANFTSSWIHYTEMTRFKVYPTFYFYIGSGDSMTLAPMGDVYNYTTLNRAQFDGLKLADELSLWYPYRPQIQTAG